MKRLLITGAAGGLGTVCRDRLGHLAETLRLNHRRDMGAARPNEEIVICDLSDGPAVAEMVAGCDAILHLGGQATESDWETVRTANIDGMYNLYEGARRHGVKRILFASSNHTIGFHSPAERLDATSLTRPDGLYGVSKVFGESIAQMYCDKFGIETALVRIGSCFPKPKNRRMLHTWLSYDDFVALCERVFTVPTLHGCPVVYGVSNNSASYWDNSAVSWLGWTPKDNAESFRAEIEAEHPPLAADAPDIKYQGGGFTAQDIHQKK